MRGQKYDSEHRSIVVDPLIQVKKSGIKKTLTDDVDSIELLKLILTELKIMNIHLQLITDEQIITGDVKDAN